MASIHGVKIYNLNSGKTLPQWLDEKQKRALSKDDEYRRRIELLQDFEFPTASQKIKMSENGQYVVVTGTYPPQVKVYDVAELSIKFERHLDSECVAMEILGSGYEKLVFLQADKNLVFHAAYGSHHIVRVPRFGRDMVYQRATCDLLIACSGPEVYRFNLDEGKFRAPLTIPGTSGVNKLALCTIHQLLAAGTDDGWLHMFDTRVNAHSKKPIASLKVSNTSEDAEVTSLSFALDGLTLGVGTSEARCLLYDLRSSTPLLVKEHQYGLPIIDIKFIESAEKNRGCVVSSDAKIVKAWDRADGSAIANVETPVNINDVCIAHDLRGDSGLLMLAGEQNRVMSYYIPTIGPAPRWCSFLDNLTEELEEKDTGTIYDDYKFITRDEVDNFGISNLIGSPMLRGYMHGFFINIQLYNRLKAVSEPFAYETYRKAKLQEKIEEKRKSRISMKRSLPSVNRELAKKLLNKNSDTLPADNPLNDDRFAQMFRSRDFEVDVGTDEYRRQHPNVPFSKDREDSDSDQDILGDQFTQIETVDLPNNSSSEEDDDMEVPLREDIRNLPKGTPKKHNNNNSDSRGIKTVPARKKPNFYELNEGEDSSALLNTGGNKVKLRNQSQQRSQPLERRLESIAQDDKAVGFDKLVRTKEGMVREFSFTPKSDRTFKERNSGNRTRGGSSRGRRGKYNSNSKSK